MSRGNFDIDLSKWNGFIEKVQNDAVAKKNYLKYVSIEMENELIRQSDKESATGTRSRSIESKISENRAETGSKLPYFKLSMETGRKPGKVPPFRALELWAMKRGMPKKAAFTISRKIAKFGTNKYSKGQPRLISQSWNRIKTKMPVYTREFFKLYIK